MFFKTFLILAFGVERFKVLAQATQHPFSDAQWPSGPGDPLVPQSPDSELAQRLEQISPDRIEQIIQKLVSFGTRSTISNQTDPTRGIGAARDWLEAEYKSFGGRLNVSTLGYLQQPAPRVPNATVITDVIATLPGTEEPDRVYVITGHYDTRNSDVLDITGDAPGANDDASGVAVSLELARVFADVEPKATIIFGAVAGEEQGLLGSAYLAQQLKAAGKDVQGMLNNDIVGGSTAADGTQDSDHIRIFLQGIPTTATEDEVATYRDIGLESDSPTRELGRFIVEVTDNDVVGLSAEPVYREDRFLRGGDHSSFLAQGFPAVRFTEPNENYAQQHQNVRVENGIQYGDLIEFVDFEYVSRVAKLNGAAIFSLADAPGTPKNVTINTSGLTNNSTLSWTQDVNAASYEIVWRATHALQWTHVIDVGATNQATILLTKDNVQFGVRAVGANGYKSPAAPPFPST